MRRQVVLYFLVLLFLVSCNEKDELSLNATIAKKYLNIEGFEVVSYEREGWQEFSKSDLLEHFNQQVWAVQYDKPDEFLNKRIDTVTFTVKNHPLDEQFNDIPKEFSLFKRV